MALWGNKDSKAVTGTISVYEESKNVLGAGTSFTTELKSGQTLFIDGTEYRIDVITDNTHLILASDWMGGDDSGLTVTANEQPAYIPLSSLEDVYGVDTGSPRYEAQVNADKGINTPGWVKYTTYLDSEGNTRHKAETLVAMATIQGDANDDAVVGDD